MATSTIFEFDGDEANPLPTTWRSKLYLLPHPLVFQFCRIKADDYDDIELRFYADGALLYVTAVTSAEEFRLPIGTDYQKFEIEVYGTSRVQTVQVVEDVEEFV